jgi:addiction module RelB/DinJ family antitoxin
MTEIFRVRVDRQLLDEASRVAEEIGTSPGEVVRILFKQMVKRRSVPFALSADAPLHDVVDVARRNEILRNLDETTDW